MGGTCETRCGRQSGHEECLSICMTVMWRFKFSCVKTMCNYNTDAMVIVCSNTDVLHL